MSLKDFENIDKFEQIKISIEVMSSNGYSTTNSTFGKEYLEIYSSISIVNCIILIT